MLQTAENVAAKHQITTEQQHETVLMREGQYRDALADNHAFQKRYMNLPFDVPHSSFRKTAGTLETDEGIRFSTPDGLSKLKTVLANGTVTYGGQTHPADGNAGIHRQPLPHKAETLRKFYPDIFNAFGHHEVNTPYISAAYGARGHI